MRKNCVKKRYFGVKSDAARSFFLIRKRQPLFEKRGEKLRGRRGSVVGVQVNFLVILEDHRHPMIALARTRTWPERAS